MTRRVQLAGALALASTHWACDPGQGPATGLTEPMLTNGQFIPGDLPGSPPPADDAAAPEAGGDAAIPLTVNSVTYNSAEIQPGADQQALGGFVSSDSVAVGMRLQGLGTGYWVVPAGAPDPSDLAEVAFSETAGFEPTIPPGLHDLLVVAIGASGQGGNQYALPLCFENPIPDNSHACNPAKPLYSAVFTLQWDANFELDLHVVTPNGDDISPETPYGMIVADAGLRGPDPSLPHIDSAGLRNCVVGARRQEDVIFPDALPTGTYTIYADPYAACGQAATVFTFTLYRPSGTCPDCQYKVVGTPVSGEVLASQVTGGVLSPLKIDEIVVGP
jgi:hypothetical protein